MSSNARATKHLRDTLGGDWADLGEAQYQEHEVERRDHHRKSLTVHAPSLHEKTIVNEG